MKDEGLPVIETGDVVDVVVLHEDDSCLSLLVGQELSVLKMVLTLQASGFTGPGFANLKERRKPGEWIALCKFIILFHSFTFAGD